LTNLQQTTITTNPNAQASAATEASAIVTDVASLQSSNTTVYPVAAQDIEKIAKSQVATLLAAGSYAQAANTLSSMIAQIMSSTAFKSNAPSAVGLVNSLAVMKQNAIAADPSTTAAAKASQAALAVQQIQAAAAAIQAATGAAPPVQSGPAQETGAVQEPAANAEVFDLGSGYGDEYGDTPLSNEGEGEEAQGGGRRAFRKSRRRVKGQSRRKSRSRATKARSSTLNKSGRAK
jgi:hypothetical protein